MFVGQVALRVIPNVEVVTLFVVCFSFALGLSTALPAAVIFCTLEWVLYGFGYWVPAYYVYWSLLAATANLTRLPKSRGGQALVAVTVAVVCTAAFGFLTTLADSLFIVKTAADFVRLYPIIYARGIYFYLVHVVSNGIVVGLLFLPITKLLQKRLTKL
jgi:hypothetical protein